MEWIFESAWLWFQRRWIEKFETAKEIQNLEDEMEKCKNDLLLNTEYSFKSCNDDKLFGAFYAKNYECRKFIMILNNFSSFERWNCWQKYNF